MKLDSREEISYRVKIAERYLKEASNAYRRRDYRLVVASSQLSVENAAKAVIAVFRIPSWSHDPSNELLELLNQLPEHIKNYARELANIARTLAPEHGRATYGEPLRGLTPWELYSEKEATQSLEMATRARELMKKILVGLGVEL